MELVLLKAEYLSLKCYPSNTREAVILWQKPGLIFAVEIVNNCCAGSYVKVCLVRATTNM